MSVPSIHHWPPYCLWRWPCSKIEFPRSRCVAGSRCDSGPGAVPQQLIVPVRAGILQHLLQLGLVRAGRELETLEVPARSEILSLLPEEARRRAVSLISESLPNRAQPYRLRELVCGAAPSVPETHAASRSSWPSISLFNQRTDAHHSR